MESWHKLNEEIIETGYRKLLRRTFRLPDGTTGVFDIKREPQVVCIVALTPDRQVILARQFRPGPEQILQELPGGCMEADETPLEAAERELLEETGYTGRLQYVGFSLDDAYTTLVRHNFVATDCHAVQEPQTGAGEYTDVVTMPLVDFRQHLRHGQLTDIETGYLGLDYLGLL
jgi:ADP-ribose pyrophosphatase